MSDANHHSRLQNEPRQGTIFQMKIQNYFYISLNSDTSNVSSIQSDDDLKVNLMKEDPNRLVKK